MTYEEKETIAGMVALFGLFLDRYKPQIEEQGNRKLRYWANKIEDAFMGFFKHYEYERTPWELKRIREFVERSQLFLLAPEDENLPELQVLMERQRRWLEGTD